MKIGILGTGVVGQTLGTKLQSLGHQVVLGSREAGNSKAVAWAMASGGGAGTFREAAGHGEIIFNCTMGSASLEALGSADVELDGKVLIDVSNPLDFSRGMPPSLFVSNTTSLGERIQATFPNARVVKSLNTVNAGIMVDPGRIGGGEHDMFVAGNDPVAKTIVSGLLAELGWKHVIDLGDITMARGLEMYLPLWVRLWGALHTADFNIKIVR
ncbi:MAG: NAD(P)-binding domain-containing protein [Deltaproteobacteria bacterium]|nr:NAD(P)-binding domain-containing protein [Deltaproteobacteria bacterium]